MYFVDGENLVFRFQKMKEEGRRPLNGIKHRANVYVWHTDIVQNIRGDIRRITYYTSAAGDTDAIQAAKEEIQQNSYDFYGEHEGGGGGRYGGGNPLRGTGRIVPRVIWKPAQAAKSKGVDIGITIDVLDSSLMDSVDKICLLTGDGDFIPLIEAVMRRGKQVHVMALSSGLNRDLPTAADSFENIDDKLFQPQT